MIQIRVGILTFHNSRNYGAVLQAYALQKKMEELFQTVEIIDYRNPKIEEELRIWTGKMRGKKSFYYSVLAALYRLRKKISFDWFIFKQMKKTIKIDKDRLDVFSEKYNLLVTGSDQVWNIGLTGNDKTYFLDFALGNSYKIAYAASFGDGELELDNATEKLLHDFQMITLRESIGREKLQILLDKDISVCCDPTLLLGKDICKKMASHRLRKGKYIFLFIIDESQELTEYAQRLAEEKGLTVVSNKSDIRFIIHPSPKDFLSWIRDAEYVVTNSFHGTIFSLLFEKKFVSLRYTQGGGSKVRIMELLNRLDLGHRFVDDSNLDIDQKEDWELIESKLSKMSTESWELMLDWARTFWGGDMDA